MYTFMKCLSWIICHIPEGCRRALGTFLGAFFWTFVPKKRKVLAQQQILDCGLTDDPEKAMVIAKASTVRFGPMIIEVLSYPRCRIRRPELLSVRMPRRAHEARAVRHPAPSLRPVEFPRALRDRAPPDYAPSHTA